MVVCITKAEQTIIYIFSIYSWTALLGVFFLPNEEAILT